MPLGYPNMPAGWANSYANNNGSATSTVDGSTMPTRAPQSFGFNAALVKITVDVGTIYLNFTSGFASTNDHKQTSGDGVQDYYTFGVPVAGVQIGATSTAAAFRVGAWG